MDVNSLLTIVSIFVAVIALLNKSQKLRLKLNVKVLDVVIICLAILSIHYLVFFDFFLKIGLSPKLNLYQYNIKPGYVSYSIFLTTLIWLIVRLKYSGLSPSKIFTFENLITQLLSEKRYQEIISLLESYLDDLKKIDNWDYPIRRNQKEIKEVTNVGLRAYTEATDWSEYFTKRKKKVYQLVNFISKFIPSFEGKAESASVIFRIITNDNELIRTLVNNKPYLGLKFFYVDPYYRNEFFKIYFIELYRQENSILFSELRNNQNKREISYELKPENKLLVALFSKDMFAEKIGVWYPLGEEVIIELNERNILENDDYNLDMGDFYDRGKYESRIYMTLLFFDIMVTKALQHNVYWHMWLSYFSRFTELMCRNISPNSNTYEPHAEWPTKYHYLLYEIIQYQCSWIRSIEDLPEDQENVVLESTNFIHENGNIPKSSIMSLVNTLYEIVTSDNLEGRFKDYMAQIVFRNYLELRRIENHSRYTNFFLSAILQGGWYERKNIVEYRGILLNCLQDNFDRIPHDHEDVMELENALQGN